MQHARAPAVCRYREKEFAMIKVRNAIRFDICWRILIILLTSIKVRSLLCKQSRGKHAMQPILHMESDYNGTNMHVMKYASGVMKLIQKNNLSCSILWTPPLLSGIPPLFLLMHKAFPVLPSLCLPYGWMYVRVLFVLQTRRSSAAYASKTRHAW